MKRLSFGILAVALVGAGCMSGQKPADTSVEVIQEEPMMPSEMRADEAATSTTSTMPAPTPSANSGMPKVPTKAGTTPTPELQPNAPATKPKPGPQTMTVTITSTGFSPQTMAVNAGDTVVWVNKSGAPQTSRSSGSLLWDSGNIPNGSSFKRVFNASGSYSYFSGSSNFTGTIVVHEAK